VAKLANELYYIDWQEIEEHYHLPTEQWSRPHSHSYLTLLGSNIEDLIIRSLNNNWNSRLSLPIIYRRANRG
jgi:hypothetical protein